MDPSLPAPFSDILKIDQDILEYLNDKKKEIIKKLKGSNITEEDIPKLEPYPSDYLMAHFASEVYKDKDKFAYPAGWELLVPVAKKGLLENGYVGAAFFNPSQQQIIIAHRGTKGLKPWWTNLISIVWGSVSSQMSSALTFSDFIRDVIVELQSEKKWRYQLSFTGHSLGGFLAQITTFGVKYLKRYQDVGLFLKSTVSGIHSHCVTFDNPGCVEMLNKITDHCDLRCLKTIFPSALDLTAYLSAPNMVNMCNRHVGVVLRLKLSFQEMSSSSSKTPRYHLKTHNMDTIKSVFHHDQVTIAVDVDQVYDWPNSNSIFFANEEYKKFFEFGKKKNDFNPNIETTVMPIGEDRFNKVRYLSKKRSVSSCNVALFSGEELFLLKHWLKIVESSIKIDETFTSLNLQFKDLFYPFEQSGDDLQFDDDEAMKRTINRCKQIVRWYPEEIGEYFKSLPLNSYDVIIKTAFYSYNESIKNCKVDFKDSIKLEKFLEGEENVLMIKPSAGNYQIEMLRLFNIFKRIRDEQSVKIDKKYTGKDFFQFVEQSPLLRLFRYNEVDLFIKSKLNLLIIDFINKTVDDDISKLIKEFAKNDRKVVIITTSEIDLSSTAFNEITTPDFKFSDLTEDSRKNVLEKYEIIKLGNETYTLETFLGTDDDNWAEEWTFLDDYEFLERILNDRCIELKNDSLNLSKLENFYIQADDQQNYSNDEFIKLTQNSDRDSNEPKIVITHRCDQCDLPFESDNKRTADLREASQYFKERCDEESSSKFYWFHYDRNFSLKEIYNPRLYIPRSFYYEMILDETKVTNCVKEELLRQEEKRPDRVTVELTKTNGRSLECSFKVKRENDQVTYVWDGVDKNNRISDVREFLTISHDGSLAEQELSDRRIVLITGDPGIGKSTTVTNLLTKTERSWIFKMTYDECTAIANRPNGKFDVDQIAEQLLQNKSDNQFDFLKYHLAHKSPIKILFFFDEIFDSSHDDQNNERRIIEFLQYLSTKTESFVIVTARETKREMIENALNICSLQFKQFDQKDVQRYLTKYWSELFRLDLLLHGLTLERLEEYTTRLLEKAKDIFEGKILNFIGIPLQMKLLAEIAAPDYTSSIINPQTSTQIQLKLPDSLSGIFEAFVKKKYDIFNNKFGSGERGKKNYLNWIDKLLLDFSASKYGFYRNDKFNSGDLETLQDTGLVQGSAFIHQTIQEFYFARQIYICLKKRERKKGELPKLKEFLMQVFATQQFSIVRMFLETHISKKTPEGVPFYF